MEKRKKTDSILIIIPTYNEAENIIPLIRDLLNLREDLEVLVMDDQSPDGTWLLAQTEFAGNQRVQVRVRRGPRGRGLAGIEGFKEALDLGAARIVEMDADFSHHPRHLLDLVRALDDYDVAIGSRFTPGGHDLRPFNRQILTLVAGAFIRRFLDSEVKDVTSGYRAFRRELLLRIPWERLISRGPSVVEEVLYIISRLDARIIEVPIVFPERERGQSTLNPYLLLETLLRILQIKIHWQNWHPY